MGTCLSFSLKDWSPAEKQEKKQLFIRLTWVQQNLWILANIIVAFERYFEWPIPASIISICSEQDRQGTRSWPATVRRCKKSIGPFLVSDSNLTLWHFDTFVASTASTFALIVFFHDDFVYSRHHTCYSCNMPHWVRWGFLIVFPLQVSIFMGLSNVTRWVPGSVGPATQSSDDVPCDLDAMVGGWVFHSPRNSRHN